MKPTQQELSKIYQNRFQGKTTYREQVWKILCHDFFQSKVNRNGSILDLGSGYGEFIRNIQCRQKLAMDLNPESEDFCGEDCRFIHQDCSQHWEIAQDSLSRVFSSNFLEHLPDKEAVKDTLLQAKHCLRSRGKLILMGPNISQVGGKYWDFWDHFTPLSKKSLKEVLTNLGFEIECSYEKFLPYTMEGKAKCPGLLIALYLRNPTLWRIFGGQFLIIAKKP